VKTISYDDAEMRLRQPGHVLMKMFVSTKRGREFYVVGRKGGPVTDLVAQRLLDHPKCHEVDPGLFPGNPQSWTLFYGK
jgi:hypothetical protein